MHHNFRFATENSSKVNLVILASVITISQLLASWFNVAVAIGAKTRRDSQSIA